MSDQTGSASHPVPAADGADEEARRGPVLVIGATGQQGGATARALLRRGRIVHALVRDADAPAAVALQRDGARLVVGDLDAAESLRTALGSVEAVFLVLTMMTGHRITPEGVQAEQQRGTRVAELAYDVGVEQLVYSSLQSADTHSGIPHYESKAAIEARIRALGLPATVLRPGSFMDNFATYSRPIARDGELVINLAVGPDVPMGLIAVRDIGELAAIALGAPQEFVGQTLTLVADVLTPQQIAETFTEVCNMPARHHQVPIEQIRVLDPQLAMMFEHFNRKPAPAPDRAVLRRIHPDLMTLRAWLTATGWKP